MRGGTFRNPGLKNAIPSGLAEKQPEFEGYGKDKPAHFKSL
jgi:hypothetical protein